MLIAEVTPKLANQALSHYNAGGYPGGSFVVALLALIGRADAENRARLALGFASHVAVIEIGERPGGIEVLQAIANAEQLGQPT